MPDELVRVIIADDNRDFAESLSDYLNNQADITVIGVAKDGTEAIDIIVNNKPDVAIIDIIMPNLDGIGVLEKINSLHMENRPRIIVLSAVGQENISNWALSLGADYYLIKPFDLDALVSRIKQLKDAAREQDEKSNIQKNCKKALDIEAKVTGILREISIPAHIKGYQYLRSAIIMVINDASVIKCITKTIYPAIAKEYGTTPSGVEHAIYHAIELSWSRTRNEIIDAVFGYSAKTSIGKPTITSFITMIADRIKKELKETRL